MNVSGAGARVAIDYGPAAAHWPGIGRYLRELVRGLVRVAEHPELVLIETGGTRGVLPEEALGLAGARGIERRRVRVPRRALGITARLGHDVTRGAAVVHGARVPLLPARGAARTLAIAELPLRGSEAEETHARAARACERVLVFSPEWIATVCARLELDAARVAAVAPGCEHWSRALDRLRAPERPPRVLVLGATRRARTPLAALAAFEVLRARGREARLVFAGRAGDAEPELARAIASSHRGGEVARRADVTEAELPALVASSSVLLHLDPEAGSAITPLEALACGAAVVASDVPVFRAALGGAAVLVPPAADAAAVAEALERALAQRIDVLHAALRARTAAAFTWERSARDHLAVWAGLGSLRAVQ